jgi:hypothetical protein
MIRFSPSSLPRDSRPARIREDGRTGSNLIRVLRDRAPISTGGLSGEVKTTWDGARTGWPGSEAEGRILQV